jgi:hypothetical protein
MRRQMGRSGEPDVQAEVPEPQVKYSAAGPVHDERQQDDGQDDHDHPEEEHDDAGDGIPGYRSRSSHGHQLPTAVRLIRRVFTGDDDVRFWPFLGRHHMRAAGRRGRSGSARGRAGCLVVGAAGGRLITGAPRHARPRGTARRGWLARIDLERALDVMLLA